MPNNFRTVSLRRSAGGAAALLSLATLAASGGCAPEASRQAASQTASRVKAQAAPAAPAAPAPAQPKLPSNLDDYIARPEAAFAWEEQAVPGAAQGAAAGGATRLKVVSQTWQGAPWTHAVEVVRPAHDAAPGAAMIVVNFGNPTPQTSFIAQLAANATGITIVNAFNVPNQPLWGRREDDLIAYTFAQYLAQNDPASDWPLLLPMTKSATQVMRAVEEWSKKEGNGAPITKWGVSGASKRGWTTWLVAAAQAKARPGSVVGIVPMVYDNLNLALQMPHQKESWGAYSEQIEDYSRRGLPDIVGTPRGRALAAIVDPWTYRERLTMPKLIVNGSNDRYWPLDAFNLYRGGLTGPTNVFYAPNSGHMLNGNEARVAGVSATWFKMVAQGKTPPQVLASVVDAAGAPADPPAGEVLSPRAGMKWRLQVLDAKGAPSAPRAVKAWVAHSPSRDFREARWSAIDLAPSGGPSTFEITLDDQKLRGEGAFHALYGEVELPGGVGEDNTGSPLTLRIPFALSSPVTIWK